ncbi:MAG: BON domain-containing protein [Vulcanimicrobiaceae bacterium]
MSLGSRVFAIVAIVGLGTGCSAQQQQQAQKTVNAVGSSAPYQAKDALIASAVMAKLAAIDLDATTNVHVAVDHGAVKLTGQARSQEERARYVKAAATVNGVTSASESLSVNPRLRGAQESVGDVALATKVAGALAAQTGVNALRVKPSVRDGVVTLSGTVDSASVKTTMLAAVRKVSGVKRVVDDIEVQ